MFARRADVSRTNASVEEDASFVFSDQLDEENLRERRYLWTARAFAVVSAVSIVANIVLVFALSSLVPLTRIQPFFLTFEDKNDQIVRVSPTNVSAEHLTEITESFVRQYVVLRNAVVFDIDEMRSRWGDFGPIRWMSETELYKKFLTEEFAKTFARIEKEGFTRRVDISSVYRQIDNSDVERWVVEIEELEMASGASEPQKKYYTVTMDVAYEPRDAKWAFRRKNPMGFIVKNYGKVEKGIQEL